MTIVYPEELMAKRIKELETENERLRGLLARALQAMNLEGKEEQ